MRIRMTGPAPAQRGKVTEVSDSYGLRLVSQGRAVVAPPSRRAAAVPAEAPAPPVLAVPEAPEPAVTPSEPYPAQQTPKPAAPKREKGGGKDGA